MSSRDARARDVRPVDSQLLAERVVVVTGTGRGLGRAIAASAAGHGARIVGVSRSSPAPDLPEASYRHLHRDLTATPAEELIEAALAAFGRVDGLVNNAGVHRAGDCWLQSDEDLDELLAANLTTPFLLTQGFARHWIDRRQTGVVVNVCSVESDVAWPEPPQAAYATTKGGLLGLTRASALELARHDIRVVAVGPGACATTMTPPAFDYAERIPLGGRPGDPADVGSVVAFLLSDLARHMTGEIVYVDGGYRLR